MPLYSVELTYRAVIRAETLTDAIRVAEDSAYEITNDGDAECDVSHAVKEAHDLPNGWDLDSGVYGDDAYRTVRQLMEQEPHPPEPDTKTIDMFAGAAA